MVRLWADLNSLRMIGLRASVLPTGNVFYKEQYQKSHQGVFLKDGSHGMCGTNANVVSACLCHTLLIRSMLLVPAGLSVKKIRKLLVHNQYSNSYCYQVINELIGMKIMQLARFTTRWW